LVVVVAQDSKITFLAAADLVEIACLVAADLEQAVKLEELQGQGHLAAAVVAAVALIMQVLAAVQVDMLKLLLLLQPALILGLLALLVTAELLVAAMQVQVATVAAG
jgi:hypothetical protein